jgi:hypothetical protein
MSALITDEQRFLLLASGRESLQNPDFDSDDHAFGLCDLGLGAPELGWVSLQELTTVRRRLGMPIERDLHLRAEMRLSACARDARMAGRIVV